MKHIDEQRILVVVGLVLVIAGSAFAADEPLEELPPPRPEVRPEKSVVVDRDPAPSDSALDGWGLAGLRGRYYSASAVALADYVRDGRRHIARLEVEDPSLHAATAESFLYFREPVNGHRWAIARYPSADQSYRIYFQAVDRPGQWRLFDRAQASFAPEAPGEPIVVWSWPEATCGTEIIAESCCPP